MKEENHIRILLVEDDPSLRFLVKDHLDQQGFAVEACEDGMQGLEAFKAGAFDICLIDVMLPKLDGFSLVEQIRNLNLEVPVLFLTARGMKEDRIRGFSTGADDYIVKPFSIEELVMRIHVFIRRSGKVSLPKDSGPFKIRSYQFDYNNLQLIHERETRKLTQKQADLLRLLILHSGKVIKRDTMLNSVWGQDDYFTGRSMDVFISKLRKYLAHDPAIQIINYHGIGFKLAFEN